MRSLEKLEVYTLTRELAVRVYRLAKQPMMEREYGAADQIKRACMSIPANIAEGYALGTRPQLVKGLRSAFGSATELNTHLWVASRVPIVDASEELTTAQVDLSRAIGMLIGLLKANGARF